MAEFTGERLIPGEVDVDLLNEHLARYAFAARMARGRRVLDAGCGAGYGSFELASTAESVTGMDRAPEALEFAGAHYRAPNLKFELGSCEALPYPDGVFDLVVSFEMIEHLEHPLEFLKEARRVLAPSGQLIISTPNKLYYTESRGPDGANPFHVHEYTFAEFAEELKSVFPHVSLFLENHVECVTFQPCEAGKTVDSRVDAAAASPDEAHFFLAVCAHRPQTGSPTFVYVPTAANLLRERERHIALLEGELKTKDEWLEKVKAEHEATVELFRAQKADLERSNQWAEELNQELEERRARVAALQQELVTVAEGYASKVASLEEEGRGKTQWALDTEARLAATVEDLKKAVEALDRTDKELRERTEWALQLRDEGERLQAVLAACRASRWVRLGRKMGVGPAL